MIDVSVYENKPEFAPLLEEIRLLRAAGKELADVCELVSAEAEPVHPDCIPCEHMARSRAKAALKIWKNV